MYTFVPMVFFDSFKTKLFANLTTEYPNKSFQCCFIDIEHFFSKLVIKFYTRFKSNSCDYQTSFLGKGCSLYFFFWRGGGVIIALGLKIKSLFFNPIDRFTILHPYI